MMKTINYAATSSLCALIIGVLLVVWPGAAINYLVIIIGVLFLLPGVLGLLSYAAAVHKKEQEGINIGFPVVALGSTLFGFWLMINPAFFVSILMYVLGALLVFGGLLQIMNLTSLKAYAHVPLVVFAIPVLVLAAGITVLCNPFEAATVPFIVLGVSGIIYGGTDLIRLWKYRQRMKEEEAKIQDITPIEEIKE